MSRNTRSRLYTVDYRIKGENDKIGPTARRMKEKECTEIPGIGTSSDRHYLPADRQLDMARISHGSGSADIRAPVRVFILLGNYVTYIILVVSYCHVTLVNYCQSSQLHRKSMADRRDFFKYNL